MGSRPTINKTRTDRRTDRRTARRACRCRLGIEPLEHRHLLAADTVVMFNDHVEGNGTHENATVYAANGVASGALKDIETGDDTHITLTVSASGATYDLLTLPPAAGTDAFNIFDGFADLSISSNAAIRVAGEATYTHTFTGLNPQATYEFVGTAIRGDGNAVDKWTRITLDGADAFNVDHSSGIGVVTDGLPNNQAALWTGDNRDAGLVVGWTDIRPGNDGTFSVISQQYLGATPGVGTGNASGGAYGYAVEALRLTEHSPSLRVLSSTIADGDRLVTGPTSITVDFSSDLDTTTVDASDLTVDGVAATAVTIVDTDTLTWTLPAGLGAGDHILSIAEGVMLNTPLAIPVQAFDITFAILGAPVVDNVAATNVTPIDAVIGGTVTNAGGDDPTLLVYWGDNDGGSNAANWDHVMSLGTATTGQSRSTVIEPLIQTTDYYYRAFAQNSAGSDWADQTASFTTPAAALPEVTISAATSVSARSARLHAAVTETGGDPPSATIYYGDEDGGTVAGAWDAAVPLGRQAGAFSHFVTGLNEQTTYFYRVFAENMAGSVWSPTAATFTTPQNIPATVVINEIHYDPDDSMELVEFIELHNPSDFVVDLSEWRIDDAVDYLFPTGTTIPAGGYLTVAENMAAFEAKFGVAAHGQWQEGDRLSNDGEVIELRDAAGERIDRVDYQLGFPWPTVGEAGRSIELINPFFENDIGGNWRGASGQSGLPDTPQTLLPAQSTWSYRKGTAEASNPVDAWRAENFTEDATWLAGQTPLGYGDGVENTLLADMRNNYSTVYLRNTFSLEEIPPAVLLRVYVDDGAIVWINGVEMTRLSVSPGHQAFDATAGSHEAAWEEFLITNTGALQVGENTIAVHALNATSGSSDMSIDVEVIIPDASSVIGTPTPNARNSVYSINAAPQMRRVGHSPKQPTGGEDVTITVTVTDPDGVEDVQLQYQLVDPGNYIRLTDAEYRSAWTSIAMVDDGTSGDEAAGDDIYTVVLPGSLQTHRRLGAVSRLGDGPSGASITGPYSDDPQPNFAYFVYDGIPAWTGADRPGVTEPVTYGTDVTNSIPAFHLISRESDVLASNYNTSFNTREFRFSGTLIVGDEIYDHVRYRIRGQNSTYVSGKNKWKLRFNRGHYFQGYDEYGEQWPAKLRTLNFGTNASPWAPANRGMAGLDEALAFKLWTQVGVASANVTPFQLRVIDSAAEASAANQYEGDLWGLYLAFENAEKQFLDAHDLPDGNLFRMQAGATELESQGFGLPGDLSDVNRFTSSSGYNRSPSQPVEWWRENVDLEGYYSFRSVMEAINHNDIRDRENMLLYFNPETGKWSMLPWDVDLLYEEFDRWGPDGVQNASQLEQFRKSLVHDEINIEFQNRSRELQDLLLNSDQGWAFIEEYARYVELFAAIDRAMWDYNPRASSSPANGQHRGAFYNEVYVYPAGNGAAGEVRRAISPVGFEGMVNWVKEFISLDGFGGGQLAVLNADDAIPETPTITFAGAAGFAADDLRFTTSAFADPQGNDTFAAIEWRLGEVSDPDAPSFETDKRRQYEVDAVWQSGPLLDFASEITIPGSAVEPGHAYRARVRMQDSTGRWSHWSAPIQFLATTPGTSDLQRYLRISELNYNPAGSDDSEFIELTNVSSGANAATLDLSGAAITSGPSEPFVFADGTSLEPGAYVLVVKDAAAFAAAYPANTAPLAGEYAGSLANDGELVALADANGGIVMSVSYEDSGLWPESADGIGASLELTDPGATLSSQLGKPHSWRGSTNPGGTPGADNSTNIGVVVNEVLSRTDPPVAATDSIELLNTTSEAIDIGGWFLSDSSATLLKFQIPAGTLLGPGEFVVFDEHDFNPTPTNPGPNDFALSGSNGDDVWLVVPDGRGGVESFVDEVHFGAALNGVSFGRVDGSVTNGSGSRLVPQSATSLGCRNRHPSVGPLVISEVNYNPAEPAAAALAVYPELTTLDLEFVEIHNPTTAAVDLAGWRMRGGVDYDFDSGAMIPAGQTIVVLSFNPDNPDNTGRLAAFRAHFGIDETVVFAGGYSGRLANEGERVTLQRPDVPPPDEATGTPYVVEDEVIYDNVTPWPLITTGQSLQRVSPTFFGNSSYTWTAAPAAPGTVAFSPGVTGDLTGDGAVDANDIDFLSATINRGTAVTAYDLDGNGTVDATDRVFLVENVLGTFMGDANLDGRVDASDLNAVGLHWQQTGGCLRWEQGNFDGNDLLDAGDLNAIGINWLSGTRAVPAPVAAAPRLPLRSTRPARTSRRRCLGRDRRRPAGQSAEAGYTPSR